MIQKSLTAVAAIILAGTAVPAIAQDTATTTADPYATTAPADDDDDSGKWGWLGLLGLAGLLGLKKKDNDRDHRNNTGGTNR
jgi:MYXO-CTERM domain-containing protein